MKIQIFASAFIQFYTALKNEYKKMGHQYGLFLRDIFEIADILLTDPDDLVQKGYGWMLKAASEAHQQEVYEYVLANQAIMPQTALRYAIEKMPPEMRKTAMAK